MSNESTAPPLVRALIPFFQRERGLLRRAVESVLGQECDAEVHVLVVDDGSPVPASEELAEWVDTGRVTIVRQENGGAGAARNRGFQEIEESGGGIVALLDSDDCWTPDHLARALEAMDSGADAYMANWWPLESPLDAYEFMQKVDVSEHRPHETLDDAYWYEGDSIVQEIERSIGRPSTLVLRWDRFRGARFPEGIRHGSEDLVWRVELYSRRPRIVFSTRPEARSGHGVNIFSGKEWGSATDLRISSCRSAALRLVQRRDDLTDVQRRSLDKARSTARTEVVGTLLHVVRHRVEGWRDAARFALRQDPGLWSALPLHMARVISRRRRVS